MPRRPLGCIKLSIDMVSIFDTSKRLRWALILPMGIALGVLTITFVYLAVYAFVVSQGLLPGDGVSPERLETFARVVGVWGARAFFLATVAVAASVVARRAGELATAHGVGVGITAALSQQGLVYATAPPVELKEFAAYLVLGITGGCLGAAEARSALATQEGVYRASRDIAAARDAAGIAAAIGQNLGGPGLSGLMLWRNTARDSLEQTFLPLASWPATNKEDASVLESEFGGRIAKELEHKRYMVVGSARGAFGRTRSQTLLIPLIASGDRRVGLLSVTFRDGRRLSRNVVRQYLTAGAQAALAIEYQRLAEENRKIGQEAGTLRERQRLAHEIHDTLAQGFTSVVTNLTAAEMVRDSKDEGLRAEEQERRHLEYAREIARESLTETRRLIWALRPESLERRSLADALKKLTEDWSRETGASAEVALTGERARLLPEAEIALLRIAQEALANVRKHAGAERVMLTLSYLDDVVILDVVDDGRGFDHSTVKGEVGAEDRGGFGLTAMRERVEQLGGELLVESSPGEGTTLAVELPLATGYDDEGVQPTEGSVSGVAGEAAR